MSTQQGTTVARDVLRNLARLFCVLTLATLVGVFVTDSWPGTNPMGVPFIAAAVLWLVFAISARTVRASVKDQAVS